MDRLYRFTFGLAALSFAVAACDGNGTPGSSGSSSSTSSASSGTGGSTNTPSAWHEGKPGTPGAHKLLGKGMTFAQGLSKHITPSGAITTKDAQICNGPGTGGAGGGVGSGGATTSGAGGSGPTMDMCPSSFQDPNPTFQTEEATPLVIASMPALRPAGCNGEYETLSLGSLYVGDCHGVTKLEPFTADDVPTFFGSKTVLWPATTLPVDGSQVTFVSGLSVKTAAVADTIYTVSNVSSMLIAYDTVALTRTDIDLGSKGISGFIALGDGTLAYATLRTFTHDSINSASNDPADLVEAEPIRIKRFDPATQLSTEIASISGTSRAKTQNGIPATVDQDGNTLTDFLPGNTNMMTLAQDGSLLFSDRLAAKVYKVALDGTVTEQFTLPEGVLISGLVQPPSGIIYVIKSATSDYNCSQMVSPPTIAYWDDAMQQLIDWEALPEASYSAVLPILLNTGTVERNFMVSKSYIGAGLHTEMSYDDLGNLVVSTTLTGTTESIHVDVTP